VKTLSVFSFLPSPGELGNLRLPLFLAENFPC